MATCHMMSTRDGVVENNILFGSNDKEKVKKFGKTIFKEWVEFYADVLHIPIQPASNSVASVYKVLKNRGVKIFVSWPGKRRVDKLLKES